jgi:cell division septal protein FtsQ
VVAVDQLRRWTGVKLGDNLFALDLARVQRNLELVPLLQSASIACIPPHTLRIRVIEREPVAQVNVPRPKAGGGVELGTFYLDAEGYVMLPLDARQRATPPSQPAEQFPIISGLNGTELQAGRRIESPPVQSALQLITAFEHSPMRGLADLKRIDVSSVEVLVVTTGQGTEVTFGLSNLDKQLRRWQAIFETAQRLNKGITALDLSVSDNIPARCVDAGALPPAASPKPLKPYKKNHV